VTTANEPGSRLAAFEALRVVELGSWVTAPAAAALLGDLGADVIKVEPPRGDPSRGVFRAVGASTSEAPTFALDNRGKRSVVLDIEDPSDSDRLHELLTAADVFVTNVRVDALERAGLSAEAVIERHPQLVYASVSGFGRRGAERNRPSYDIGAFWARSGLSHQLSPNGTPPLNVIGAIGDHVTSLSTTVAILAALVERHATGRGGIVETSLVQSGAWVLGWDLALQATSGRVHRADARDDARTPLMNSYRTADDRWLFLMGLEVERHLGAICEAIGRPELHSDERFKDAPSVRTNRRALISILDVAFATRSLAEWRPRLDEAGVWWSPCSNPAEVLADAQLHANDVFTSVHTRAGPAPMVASPFRVFAHSPAPGPAPELGEHSGEILNTDPGLLTGPSIQSTS
jgi:crotonobetainyl-CoA:carnitine CoA-transferase CaiB-like acyl-CoA transferase